MLAVCWYLDWVVKTVTLMYCKGYLGEINPDRVKFLVAQESDDEIAEGVKIVAGLAEYAASFKREPISVSKLVVGMKCGGSDGFSGITANPTVGRFF